MILFAIVYFLVKEFFKCIKKLYFNRVRAEAQELWTKLIAQDQNNASIILKKIEMTMGHKMKLSEFTEDQCDLLALVVDEMKTM